MKWCVNIPTRFQSTAKGNCNGSSRTGRVRGLCQAMQSCNIDSVLHRIGSDRLGQKDPPRRAPESTFISDAPHFVERGWGVPSNEAMWCTRRRCLKLCRLFSFLQFLQNADPSRRRWLAQLRGVCLGRTFLDEENKSHGGHDV